MTASPAWHVPAHPTPSPTPNPRVDYYINSWSARTTQRMFARVVDSGFALGVVALVLVLGPHGRPLAQDLLIVALVAGFEALLTTRIGATAGMRAAGIRVAQLGHSGCPDALTALRRSIPVALCYPILLPGTVTAFVMPFALLVSIGLSPLRRAFHDRLSGTVVVQAGAPTLITEASLATWWEPGAEPVLSPWGRVPDLYDRRRARAHRVDGAWWLVGLIVITSVTSVGMRDVPFLWLWSTLLWLVAATIDETWWLWRKGATPGHVRAGYRVVDLATGDPPSRNRSLLRSMVLMPLLYIPPFQLLLALWVHTSALHRGPHDLIAKTIVVEPDYVEPNFLPRLVTPVPVYANHGIPAVPVAYPGYFSGVTPPGSRYADPHQVPGPTIPASTQGVGPF